MNIFKMSVTAAAALSALALASCSDDEKITNNDIPDTPERPDWYYAGGKLGTTELATSNVFEQPTVAVENQGLYQSFKNGEALFEKPFMTNTDGVRGGLGPVYIRTSCLHCHPLLSDSAPHLPSWLSASAATAPSCAQPDGSARCRPPFSA